MNIRPFNRPILRAKPVLPGTYKRKMSTLDGSRLPTIHELFRLHVPEDSLVEDNRFRALGSSPIPVS